MREGKLGAGAHCKWRLLKWGCSLVCRGLCSRGQAIHLGTDWPSQLGLINPSWSTGSSLKSEIKGMSASAMVFRLGVGGGCGEGGGGRGTSTVNAGVQAVGTWSRSLLSCVPAPFITPNSS